jgi:hypothetical protein
MVDEVAGERCGNKAGSRERVAIQILPSIVTFLVGEVNETTPGNQGNRIYIYSCLAHPAMQIERAFNSISASAGG